MCNVCIIIVYSKLFFKTSLNNTVKYFNIIYIINKSEKRVRNVESVSFMLAKPTKLFIIYFKKQLIKLDQINVFSI